MKKTQLKFTASKSSGDVSAILYMPDNTEALYIFAHGAGAGMEHSFMEAASVCLANEGVGTFRFNFPYSEKKLKRPDPSPILLETFRSAVQTAKQYSNDLPLFAGGKSMGGRMSSMASASEKKLEGIKGLIFFGFPLHAPGKPSSDRAEHLYNVRIPMLFLQGTRDKLADLDLLTPVVNNLGKTAKMHIIEGADHSFNMLKSIGRTNKDVLEELARTAAEWIKARN